MFPKLRIGLEKVEILGFVELKIVKMRDWRVVVLKRGTVGVKDCFGWEAENIQDVKQCEMKWRKSV